MLREMKRCKGTQNDVWRWEHDKVAYRNEPASTSSIEALTVIEGNGTVSWNRGESESHLPEK